MGKKVITVVLDREFLCQMSVKIDHMLIKNNTSVTEGGGIHNVNVNYAYFESITVKGNNATKGGGLFSQNSNLDLVNSLIVENALTGQDDGGGIYLSENGAVKSSIAVANNTIFDGRNEFWYVHELLEHQR